MHIMLYNNVNKIRNETTETWHAIELQFLGDGMRNDRLGITSFVFCCTFGLKSPGFDGGTTFYAQRRFDDQKKLL